jgi:hypothetical protein
VSDILGDVRTYLLTQSGVTSLVGTRIHFNNLPQSATLPSVVLELTSSRREARTLTSSGDLWASDVTLLAYATTNATAASLATALDAAVERKSGTWGSTTVTTTIVSNLDDSLQSPRDGSDLFYIIRALFLTIWHR